MSMPPATLKSQPSLSLWEAQPPHVAQALRQRAEAQAQHAPTFRPGVPDTRLTAQAAWEALRAPG